jgi:hypothetical protein
MYNRFSADIFLSLASLQQKWLERRIHFVGESHSILLLSFFMARLGLPFPALLSLRQEKTTIRKGRERIKIKEGRIMGSESERKKVAFSRFLLSSHYFFVTDQQEQQ